MSLSLSYNIRNIQERLITNLLSLIGIALVISVFAAGLMLAAGLRETLSSTGSLQNIIITRNGAQNEIQSGISREHANIIISQPEIARTQDNQPLTTTDLLVLLSLKKRSNGQPSNVNVRGTTPKSLLLREDIRLAAGNMPTPGTQEIMVGSAILKRFANTELGKELRLAGVNWKVVGIFDGGNSGFSSEIWGDVDVMMPIFRRDRFSSVTARLSDNSAFDNIKQRLENDPRLSVEVKREKVFYEDQSRAMSNFITYFGTFVTFIFSLAAIIGCMITTYSSVAGRTREIGILRALGFSRFTILNSFLKEALIISLISGFIGISIASLLSLVTISTTNFQTFSDLTFGFTMNIKIIIESILFALIMGTLGAIIPAWKASRMKIVDAIRRA